MRRLNVVRHIFGKAKELGKAMEAMIKRINSKVNTLINQYVVISLFLAVVILLLVEKGDTEIVGVLGLILCAIGFAQRPVRVDLHILVPLLLYNAASAISSFSAYGNILQGFMPVQIILPVIYLLMACLDEEQVRLLKRLCVVLTGAIAVFGIYSFAYRSLVQKTVRLNIAFGGPNALGILFAMAWFNLEDCLSDQCDGDHSVRWMRNIEPLLLIAMALTLSLGSFLSMAVGMVVLFFYKREQTGVRESMIHAVTVLAKVSFGVGIGLTMYLTASKTGLPWLCMPYLIYVGFVSVLWRRFEWFLKENSLMAFIISITGILTAVMMVLIRPNSFATFAERLAMMQNAIGYLTVNPLWGIGPYKWSWFNMQDERYFGTYYIHNTLLHAGVEIGLVAMTMLIIVVVFAVYKKSRSAQKAGLVSFFCHNLIDIAFFYAGFTSMMIVTMGNPRSRSVEMGAVVSKLIFSGLAVLFAYSLYFGIR